MAKHDRNAPADEAAQSEGATFTISKVVQVEGLGSRGKRKLHQGEMSFDWRTIPNHIAELLLFEGASSELYTASTAAERAYEKLLEEGRTDEAADYLANFSAHALGYMEARVAQWQAGNFGRTRGMTDPVEQRAQKIATDRFLAMVAAGRVKNVPPNAKLTPEQRNMGRDAVLARSGEDIRNTARAQIAEEARRAKEAASIGSEFELEL